MIKMKVLPEQKFKMEIKTDIIEPKLVDKTFKKNGTYNPKDENADGYGVVTVDTYVPEFVEKDITENGEYVAQDDNADGYSKVNVNVQPPLQDKTVTENGKVTADGEYYGLKEVNVNVPQGVFPNGTKDITENGTHGVREYENVNVNVVAADPRVKGIIEKTLTEISDESITTVGEHAFSSCYKLSFVHLPNVIKIEDNAFYYCSAFTEISFPIAESMGTYAFSGCQKLKTVNLPKVQAFKSYAFYINYALETVNAPLVTTIGSYCFQYSAIKKLNFPNLTKVESSAFYGASQLTTLIIGTTDCVLANTNTFNNTKISSGTGFIYVPDEAVETYKAATNWSTYASQIKGISELPTE